MRLKVLVSNLKDEQFPDSKIIEIHKSYCVIGRKEADLILDDPRCSKQQAVLFQAADGSLHIRDMGSTNWTFVDGVKVIDTALGQGNEIRIGKCYLSILDFESVAVSGVKVTDGILAPEMTAGETVNTGGHSKPTSRPPSLPRPHANRFVEKPTTENPRSPFICFVDEDGTESRLDLKELASDLGSLGNQGKLAKPRKASR